MWGLNFEFRWIRFLFPRQTTLWFGSGVDGASFQLQHWQKEEKEKKAKLGKG